MTEDINKTLEAMYGASKEKLLSAKQLFESGFYNDSLSRAYYAVFHIISLLLFLKGKTYNRHGQLIGDFNKEFIATGLLPRDYGKTLSRLFDERQSGDYDIFVKAEKPEVEKGIKDAEMVIDGVRQYIEKEYNIILE